MTDNLILFEKYRKFFTCYEKINAMQEILLTADMSKSLVLSAPSGAGKTFSFDMALVKLHEQKKLLNQNLKAVYVAPSKALCSERCAEWMERFQREKKMNTLNCQKITGDESLSNNDLAKLQDADLIVTTPETWEYLTRQWLEHQDMLGAIKLVMIDEVQIVDEDERGHFIEVIVSRMKTIARHTNCEIRFVIATANVPNISDITAWIKSGDYMVEEYIFGENYRSVPLEKHVVRIEPQKNMNDILNNYVLEYIRAYNKSTLVFCNTTETTESTAKFLFDYMKSNDSIVENGIDQQNLTKIAQSLNNEDLKYVLPNGVAFHYADLTVQDRKIIEENFRNKKIRVLFSTSTLACGVNLPANLVIIKGTEFFYGKEYPGYLLAQMVGRAGRQQYGTDQATAIILTKNKRLCNVESIVDFESHLFDNDYLLDILCIEVVLKTINDRTTLRDWISMSYLYVHAHRSPSAYKLNTYNVEEQLLERCEKEISDLCNENLLLTKTCDHKWQGTPHGLLMVKYSLHVSTMRDLLKLKEDATLFEVFQVITRAADFKILKLKKKEKNALNKIQGTKKMSLLRFPINKNIQTLEEKVSCLLQASLGNQRISPAFLQQQAEKMRKIALRISKCIFEIIRSGIQSVAVPSSPKFFSSPYSVQIISYSYKTLLAVVTMAKCLHVNRWEKSEYVMQQLSNVDESGKFMLQSLMQKDEGNIELEALKQERLSQQLPVYSLKVTLSNDSTHMDKDIAKVLLVAKQTNRTFSNESESSSVFLIVGHEEENTIFHFKEFSYQELVDSEPYEISLNILRSSINHIKAHLIHSELVGVDCEETLFVKVLSTGMQTPEKKRKTVSVNTTPRKKNKPLDPNQPKLTNFFSAKKPFDINLRLNLTPSPSPTPTYKSPVEMQMLVQSEENLFKSQDFLDIANSCAPQNNDDNYPKSQQPTPTVNDVNAAEPFMELGEVTNLSNCIEINMQNTNVSEDVLPLDLARISTENTLTSSQPLDLTHMNVKKTSHPMFQIAHPMGMVIDKENQNKNILSTLPALQTNNITANEQFNFFIKVMKSYLEIKHQAFDYDTFHKVYGNELLKMTNANNCVKTGNVPVDTAQTRPRSTPADPSKYRLILEPDPNKPEAEMTNVCDEDFININSRNKSTIIEETNLGETSTECEIIGSISLNESPELLTYEEYLQQNNILY